MEEHDLEKTLKEQMMPKESWEITIPERLRRCTKALFYEYRHQTTVDIPAPFTLGYADLERDGTVYRSMYLEYMKYDSEYEAAIGILGSYSHWKKLRQCKWFMVYLEEWNEERDIRDEAIARSVLIKLAEAGNVTAARTIYTNSTGDKPKRGRKPATSGKRESDLKGHSVLDEMLERHSELN